MSWLEDFSHGEAMWRDLLASPSITTFVERIDAMSPAERKLVFLYHAIREKQASGQWEDWPGVRVE